MSLQDPFGRSFHYLRLSVTDVCNFRCTYCLPNGYQKPSHAHEALSVDEIRRLVAGFASMGFWKVRLSGGEPTVRTDLLEIIRAVAATPGIRRVALSTNGSRLYDKLISFKEAGLAALNISIDSLDPEVFRRMTGMANLPEILVAVDRAVELDFSVKINAVLMRGLNDTVGKPVIEDFARWLEDRPVTVRFIELMRTGQNGDLFANHHVSAAGVRAWLEESGWTALARGEGDGPATEFAHPKFRGRFGVIAPYSKDFCTNCNRLRVSSLGRLRLCLFGDGDHDLRSLLQSDEHRPQLTERIRTVLGLKEPSHYLHEGNYGNTWNLSSIGG